MDKSLLDDKDITSLKPVPNRKKVAGEGYIYLKIPKHPQATQDGYYLEHRFIVEKHLNRFLGKKEVVHHRNHITSDNRLENLEVYDTSGKHVRENHSIKDKFGRFTKPGKIVFDIKKGYWFICICGKKQYSLPSKKRKYCSQKCMAIAYKTTSKPWLYKPHKQETKLKMSLKAQQRNRNKFGKFS